MPDSRSNITKLLVIRSGALGDLIHVSAAIARLHQQHPEIEIHLLTAPMYAELCQQFEGVSRVWTLRREKSWFVTWRTLSALSDKLKQAGIDGVVNLHPNLRHWLLTRLILGGKSAQQGATYAKEKLYAPAAEKRQMARRHAVEDFFEPFRELLRLEFAKRHELIPHLRIQGEKPQQTVRIGLIPGVGGKRSNRAWPLSHYEFLIQALHQHYPQSQFVLIGGPDETANAETLTTHLSDRPIENHCGKHSILETASLLASCHLVIGGDTGPLHLCAAVGTPILALYAPTDIKRTGPLGEQPIITLTPPDDRLCWPCESPRCRDYPQDPLSCMRTISYEKVAQQAVALLNQQIKPQ